MKRIFIGALAAMLMLAAGCTASSNPPSGTEASLSDAGTPAAQKEDAVIETGTPAAQTTRDTEEEMTITSGGIAGGYMSPAYGANGSVKEGKIPVLSLPLEISNAPEGTACFAVYMDDPDAVPLCGYRWVHWMAVNITVHSIPEDFSRTAGSGAVQGKNDSGTAGYAGPMPPDKDHTYAITVYALDAALELPEGFSKTEFAAAIEGHVLSSAMLEGIYKK
jgi:hypothetical protein